MLNGILISMTLLTGTLGWKGLNDPIIQKKEPISRIVAKIMIGIAITMAMIYLTINGFITLEEIQ